MKVLQPGTGQKGWSKECKCTGDGNGKGGCGALLLVEQPDLFRTESHARDETTYYTTFKCSECGVLTDIVVPSTIAAGLPSKRTWFGTS